MKRWKYVLFFFYFFSGFAAHAQAPEHATRTLRDADSIQLLSKLSEESIYKQPDRTVHYSEQLLTLAQKNRDEKAMATACLVLARHYTNRQEFEKSLAYLDKAQKLFGKLHMTGPFMKALRLRAEMEMRKSNFEVSMKLLQANIDANQKLGNLTEMAVNTAIIGSIFLFNEQYEEAEKHMLKALNLIRKTSSKREESIILSNLASCYINWGKFDEGKKYLDAFFAIQQQLNDPVLLATAKVSLANYYLYKEQHDQALGAYDEALSYFEKIHEIPKMAFTLKRRADLNSIMGDYRKAIADADRGIALLKGKNEMDLYVADLYYMLYLSNKALGKYKEAMEAFGTAYDYKSKAISSETNASLLELREKYETEKKEEEIKLLQEQHKTKDAVLEARMYALIALSLLIVFSIIGVILLRRQQQLKQQKKASELEHRVLRAQMNPHFIFNALNSIQRVYVEGNTDKANDFMADFAQLMRKVMEHSGSTKISVQEEIDTLRLYLDLEKLRCKNRFEYTVVVDENLSAPGIQIPPLIIQPFVENAIWHGVVPLTDRKGKITVSLKANPDRTILVSVTDNGIGFGDSEKNKEHISKGIEITEQRIGGKVTVNSEKGKGTIIAFILKTA